MKATVYTLLATFLIAGLFAPIIANDRPIVASVGGDLHFPAFRTYLGEFDQGPGGLTWKRWWARLPEDSEDWAVMPFIPYGPNEVHRGFLNATPSLGVHYLGNDHAGRDVLTRLIHGASTALFIALGTLVLAMLIGVPLGALAGYFGGVVDLSVTSVLQIFLCFPPLFFVLAATAFVGSSLTGVVVVLGLLYWVSFARIVRGEILVLRDREFVKCARGLGVGRIGIIVRHLLPAVRGPILVNGAFVAASSIIVESTLSFLGLGPGLRTVSWGQILMQGKQYSHLSAWHLWLFPAMVLVTLLFGLHYLADRARGKSAGT